MIAPKTKLLLIGFALLLEGTVAAKLGVDRNQILIGGDAEMVVTTKSDKVEEITALRNEIEANEANEAKDLKIQALAALASQQNEQIKDLKIQELGTLVAKQNAQIKEMQRTQSVDNLSAHEGEAEEEQTQAPVRVQAEAPPNEAWWSEVDTVSGNTYYYRASTIEPFPNIEESTTWFSPQAADYVAVSGARLTVASNLAWDMGWCYLWGKWVTPNKECEKGKKPDIQTIDLDWGMSDEPIKALAKDTLDELKKVVEFPVRQSKNSTAPWLKVGFKLNGGPSGPPSAKEKMKDWYSVMWKAKDFQYAVLDNAFNGPSGYVKVGQGFPAERTQSQFPPENGIPMETLKEEGYTNYEAWAATKVVKLGAVISDNVKAPGFQMGMYGLAVGEKLLFGMAPYQPGSAESLRDEGRKNSFKSVEHGYAAFEKLVGPTCIMNKQ